MTVLAELALELETTCKCELLLVFYYCVFCLNIADEINKLFTDPNLVRVLFRF